MAKRVEMACQIQSVPDDVVSVAFWVLSLEVLAVAVLQDEAYLSCASCHEP